MFIEVQKYYGMIMEIIFVETFLLFLLSYTYSRLNKSCVTDSRIIMYKSNEEVFDILCFGDIVLSSVF